MVQNRNVELIKRGISVLGWILLTLVVVPVTALIASSLPFVTPLLGLIIGIIVMVLVYYVATQEIDWV